tara:strand:+ start:389 stop:907 length:519 start_codon:yes stop_codon:yes gene_type:complete
VVVVQLLQIQHLTQVPLNMVMLVVLLVLMLVVVVEQVMLDNHMMMIMLQEQVVLEYKHQLHSEIQMQDMVQIFLEEIHLEMIGHLLVEAVVVEILVVLSLVVVLLVQVIQEEYQVDHTMVQELVPGIPLHQQNHQHQHLQTLVVVVEEEIMVQMHAVVTAVPVLSSSHILPN